jgi:NhaA family Na+:H+ antiporter
MFLKLFRSESFVGLLLIVCVIVSLLVANSSWRNDLSDLLSIKYGNDDLGVNLSLLLWINDGLMAIFFLLIGLEIKREVVDGELSSAKKAAMPVFAAIGGALFPAVIFYFINRDQPTARGWGIPMATDIAFALGILALIGKRVPPALKIFLATLAIADDLIAILVIAIFYSAQLHYQYLFFAAAVFLIMIVFNRLHLKSLWFYLIPGIMIWYLVHHSGVHPTIAGVVTAFAIPVGHVKSISPLHQLEHFLKVPVNYLIMPVFALANTNIYLGGSSLNLINTNLGIGIILGLIVGKPIGITLLSWLSVKLNWSRMPAGARWGHIAGLGMLGGIGFTMSIFISLLSYNDPALQSDSKIAILIASAFSGVAGLILLLCVKMKKGATTSSQEPG